MTGEEKIASSTATGYGGQFDQPLQTRFGLIFSSFDRPGEVVLATWGIHRPELACENSSCCLLLLADSREEEYNLKH